jgi:hypothetical protein
MHKNNQIHKKGGNSMVKKITGMIVLLCLIVAMFGFSAYADELKSIEGMKIELDIGWATFADLDVVAKMKEYMDKGIITEEEFEKNKQDILKNIKF